MTSTTPLTPANAPLDPAFLALLCCPQCAERPHLQWDAARQILCCPRRGHEYPFAAGYEFPDLRPPLDAETPRPTETTP